MSEYENTGNHRVSNTGNCGNFQTALMLSLEVELSGQLNRVPLLKYFSARRLQDQVLHENPEKGYRKCIFPKAKRIQKLTRP